MAGMILSKGKTEGDFIIFDVKFKKSKLTINGEKLK